MAQPEIDGDGDCYVVAAHFMVDLPDAERSRYRLCHGTPLGRGPINGLRFGHAWVERTDGDHVTVIDRSNGSDLELPQSLYYAIGAIDPEEVKRYTAHEAILFMLETEHYGPWEE